MSESDPNYRKALDRADITWSPAAGLVKEGTQVTTSLIARQNNLVIELLLSLHNRVARLEDLVGKQENSRITEEIGEISAKLSNIKLDRENPTTVRKGTGVLAFWKDPTAQVQEYKKKYGSTS